MPDTTDRVNTPLLTLITQQSLDEDYQAVAERRAAGNGGTPPRRRPARTAGIVVAAFGLLVTVAAVQTNANEGVQSAGRESLIQQIDASKSDLAHLQRRIVRLREHNLALQSRFDDVASEQQEAVVRNERLAAGSGFGPVQGPGVRVTVDDSPTGGLVVDHDLRPLVNGLWDAGAEAISVNGQRLTSRSAIRNSGNAIQVNSRPLSPPYVVQAIGDPLTLEANLMETTGGLLFRDRVTSFGYPWDMDTVDDLQLPAAPAKLLRLRNAAEGTAVQNLNDDKTEQKMEAPQ
ncbi:DUF881 domain-containing protein [Nocardioides sp. SR21]|uniref:DUF881 domain-containing protein n=1 Tax=Nocardioides sp. SR21 TaxID=2919501 RepID=UPI001FA96101|nr:DUF881 domain-containing protein [Nocardioides sp. SR21]